MANPLEYIRQNPKLAKQLIGLSLAQLEKLISTAISMDQELNKKAELQKVRVNKKGAKILFRQTENPAFLTNFAFAFSETLV